MTVTYDAPTVLYDASQELPEGDPMPTFRNSRERAQGIYSATVMQGGATYLFDDPISGAGHFLNEHSADGPTYVVGGAAGVATEAVHRDALGAAVIRAKLVEALQEGAEGVSTWTDGDYVYIDAVDVYYDPDAALQVARFRGETAIWDAWNHEEIVVEP